jgi:hypothetical protein
VNTTTALLQEFFGERIVRCGVAFGHRELQTLPRQTSLCGDFSKKVYTINPRSLEELKHNIEQAVANIDPETLREVARNTLKRVDDCLQEGGGHFQHLPSAVKLFCKFFPTNKNETQLVCLVILM